jgi:hypothetical protein
MLVTLLAIFMVLSSRFANAHGGIPGVADSRRAASRAVCSVRILPQKSGLYLGHGASDGASPLPRLPL